MDAPQRKVSRPAEGFSLKNVNVSAYKSTHIKSEVKFKTGKHAQMLHYILRFRVIIKSVQESV